MKFIKKLITKTALYGLILDRFRTERAFFHNFYSKNTAAPCRLRHRLHALVRRGVVSKPPQNCRHAFMAAPIEPLSCNVFYHKIKQTRTCLPGLHIIRSLNFHGIDKCGAVEAVRANPQKRLLIKISKYFTMTKSEQSWCNTLGADYEIIANKPQIPRKFLEL